MTHSEPSFPHLCRHAAELLEIHEALLKDRERNEAFFHALQASIQPGDHVLDLGSGTGIWAFTALRLGAARVVAVERDAMMANFMRQSAAAQGVGERLQVIEGDAFHIDFAEAFDVIVSETIGHHVFDEDVVPLMAHARERFLKPGGRLIPGRVALLAAPACLAADAVDIPAGLDERMDEFSSLLMHRPLPIAAAKSITLLAPPASLVECDLRSAAECPSLNSLSAAWPLPLASSADAVLVWAEMELAPCRHLSARDTSSWSATAYRFRPVADRRGTLRFQLGLSPETHEWRVESPAGRQVYSPAHAAQILLSPPFPFGRQQRLSA